MVGAYAGNKLGAVRDAKGKSVAAVFTQLGGDQKAQVRSTYLRCFILLLTMISFADTQSPGDEGSWYRAIICPSGMYSKSSFSLDRGLVSLTSYCISVAVLYVYCVMIARRDSFLVSWTYTI